MHAIGLHHAESGLTLGRSLHALRHRVLLLNVAVPMLHPVLAYDLLRTLAVLHHPTPGCTAGLGRHPPELVELFDSLGIAEPADQTLGGLPHIVGQLAIGQRPRLVERQLDQPGCVAPAPTPHHAHAPETHDERLGLEALRVRWAAARARPARRLSACRLIQQQLDGSTPRLPQ